MKFKKSIGIKTKLKKEQEKQLLSKKIINKIIQRKNITVFDIYDEDFLIVLQCLKNIPERVFSLKLCY